MLFSAARTLGSFNKVLTASPTATPTAFWIAGLAFSSAITVGCTAGRVSASAAAASSPAAVENAGITPGTPRKSLNVVSTSDTSAERISGLLTKATTAAPAWAPTALPRAEFLKSFATSDETSVPSPCCTAGSASDAVINETAALFTAVTTSALLNSAVTPKLTA